MGYKTLKFYDNRAGVDSRTNDVRKPENYARDCANSIYSNRDDIEKRKGGKIISDDGPGFGNFVLRQVDPDTLEKIDKPIGMDEDGYLRERQSATLSVSYSGGATACLARLFYDTSNSEFRFQTFEDGTLDLDVSLGIGKDEVSPTDLADLQSTIDGDANYSASVSGTDSIPAAYLELVKDHDLADSDLELTAYEWKKAHTSMTNAEASITEASASGLVTEGSDKVNSTSHPFADGDLVLYETDDTAIGGLEDKSLYWVRNSGANDFELSATSNGDIIDLKDDGVGNHTFTKWDFVGLNTRRRRNEENHELTSFAQQNNVAYFTDGGFLWKYDGIAAYRAGLPELAQSGVPPTQGTSGGSLTSSAVYKWRFRYRYRDASGNIIYSDYVDRSITLTGSAVKMTFNDLSPVRRELMFPCFNANAASTQSNSAGSDWTVTVTSGHNLKAGMMAVYYDNNLGQYSTSKILSVTSTTITMEAISVSNQISTTAFTGSDRIFGGLYQVDSGANLIGERDPGALVVEVYRTQANGSVFYKEADVYVADDSNNVVHESTVSDANLLLGDGPFDEVGIFPKEPRIAKYISTWQNQLIQGGRPPESTVRQYKRMEKANALSNELIEEDDIAAADFFYWNDALFIEGFPKDGLHEDDVYTNRGDSVTGIAPNKDSLFVFKDQSMALVTGNVALNNVAVEMLETDRGCISHSSIKDVQGSLVWLDQNYGFQTIIAGQLPKSVGISINNIVKENPRSGESKRILNKAVAVNFEFDDKYICAIPAESLTSDGERYSNGNGLICVFDYAEYELDRFRMAWHYWSGIDMTGGLYVIDNELFWSSRRYSSDLSSLKFEHWKQSNLADAWDYQDHNEGISWFWQTAFLNGGSQSIDKIFNNLLVKSSTDTVNDSFDLEIEQYGNYEPDRLLGQITKTFSKVAQAIKKNINYQLATPKLESASFKLKNSQEQTNVSISGVEVYIEGEFDTEYKY